MTWAISVFLAVEVSVMTLQFMLAFLTAPPAIPALVSWRMSSRSFRRLSELVATVSNVLSATLSDKYLPPSIFH